MATRRSKKSLKDRPKYRQAKSLRNRRKKAKLAGAQRRSIGGIKARRKRRGKLKKR